MLSLARRTLSTLLFLLALALIVLHFRSLRLIESIDLPLPHQRTLTLAAGAGRAGLRAHDWQPRPRHDFVYRIPPGFSLDTLAPETLQVLLLDIHGDPTGSLGSVQWFDGPATRDCAVLFPTWVASAACVALLPLLHLLGSIGQIRDHSRLRRGLCPSCRYDLRATPHRCPECGLTVTRPSLLARLVPHRGLMLAFGVALVLLSTSFFSSTSGPRPALPAGDREPGRAYTERVPTRRHPLQPSYSLPPFITIEMVYIPTGTFLMGSPETEPGHQPSESPLHPVQVDGFWMSRFEIPWEVYWAWKQAMPPYSSEADGDPADRNPGSFPIPEPTGPPTFNRPPLNSWATRANPLTDLTPYAGQRLCQWLTRQTGRFYRLPTEAEWEYAARAGAPTPCFFGSDPTLLPEFAHMRAWAPATPGTRRPNLWGLYDIYGNVAEWTLDGWRDSYTAASREPVQNPFVGIIREEWEDETFAVARGGHWNSAARDLRSAARQREHPLGHIADGNPNWDGVGPHIGFRIVSPLRRHHDERDHPTRLSPKGG